MELKELSMYRSKESCDSKEEQLPDDRLVLHAGDLMVQFVDSSAIQAVRRDDFIAWASHEITAQYLHYLNVQHLKRVSHHEH